MPCPKILSHIARGRLLYLCITELLVHKEFPAPPILMHRELLVYEDPLLQPQPVVNKQFLLHVYPLVNKAVVHRAFHALRASALTSQLTQTSRVDSIRVNGGLN